MLTLRPFTPDALGDVEPWFDDAETRRRLGGRDWPANLLRLIAAPPSERRGLAVRQRLGWIADADGVPIALIDVEVYDDRSAAMAFVVAPSCRRRGLGVATLRTVAARLAEHHCVTRLVGGVEPANVASARCALAAGFTPSAQGPDAEGFVDYVLELEPGRS